MNIDDIISNLNYENMNIDNYAYIDTKIDFEIKKKIYKESLVKKKNIYFKFTPFLYKKDKKIIRDKIKEKNFITQKKNEIKKIKIPDISKLKQELDKQEEKLNQLITKFNEIYNNFQTIRTEIYDFIIFRYKYNTTLNIYDIIIKNYFSEKNLYEENIKSFLKNLNLNNIINNNIKEEEEKKEEKEKKIDEFIKDLNKKYLKIIDDEYLIYYNLISSYNNKIEKIEEIYEFIEEDNKIIINFDNNDNIYVDQIKKEKENLEKDVKKLEEDVKENYEYILKIEKDVKENYEYILKNSNKDAESILYNILIYKKVLNLNDDIQLYELLKNMKILENEYELLYNEKKKKILENKYELLYNEKEKLININIINNDNDIKNIYDTYENLIKTRIDININDDYIIKIYKEINNYNILLDDTIEIDDDNIKNYFYILYLKKKYLIEYEKNKKKIEDSKIILKNNLQKKLKTPYFVRENLNYINLFKINDKTPINLGTYEVSGEQVDKKKFEIILCSKSDYEKKIDEINGYYNFNHNNIFYIEIYDKKKISDNMEKKYSYFVGENILQQDGYIYTKEFNFITNSEIKDYKTDEDYYEGYIKPIKDIDNPKLLDYICEYNFYPFIINTFILYNKYLSKFNRKLKIKFKNANQVKEKIDNVVNNIKEEDINKLNDELQKHKKDFNVLISKYLSSKNNFIDSLEKIITYKRIEINKIKTKKKINDIEITEDKNYLNIQIKKIKEKIEEDKKKIEEDKKKIEKEIIKKEIIEKEIDIKKKEEDIKKKEELIKILNLYIEISEITNDIKIIRDLKEKINIKNSIIQKYNEKHNINIQIEDKEYDINEFKDIILFLQWKDINYDSLVDNINIVIKNLHTIESIDLKSINLESIDSQYKKTINDIYNKENKTLSEYFFSCIIYDIIKNNYNKYKEKQYLCIDNFYVDTLNNNLYIDRIF